MKHELPPVLVVPPFLQSPAALNAFACSGKANRKQLGEFRDWFQALRDRTAENVSIADEVLGNLRAALGEFNA